jgi:hypothetical protein
VSRRPERSRAARAKPPAGQPARHPAKQVEDAGASPATAAAWAPRFIRNVLLWLLPVWAAWALATPVYNRFLLAGGANLLHLSESPPVTIFHRNDDHNASVERRDFPPGRALVGPVLRVTDIHFHLVLLGALFLAVPGISWRRKLENLGWAALVTVFFDLALVFLYVKFLYATQLGAWSLAHYGPWARNVYGLARHLLDLPYKLALPFALWAAFYLHLLGGARDGAPPPR